MKLSSKNSEIVITVIILGSQYVKEVMDGQGRVLSSKGNKKKIERFVIEAS